MPLISLQPASLALTEADVPYSPAYNDIYHSREGGLQQAQQVFLAGNHLPGNWQQRDAFVIIETGFGIGLNFLSTWAAWRDDPARCETLHFISIEKHPFSAEDLQQLLSQWPGLEPLADQLLQSWPCLTPGIHRLRFEQGRVVLTLVFDDVLSALKNLNTGVDAIYLDGFAPNRNPDMWSLPVLRALAQLSVEGTTLATYTVATAVCDGLSDVGFNLQKQAGFGGKKDMLVGEYRVPRKRVPQVRPQQAIVIGAGLAGCQIGAELARRGCNVVMIERADAPAQATSGNWAGCYLPAPSRDDNLSSRLTRAGFLALQQRLPGLQVQYPELGWSACGVLQMGKDQDDEIMQQQTAAALLHPLNHLQYLDQSEASTRAGLAVPAGGWWFGTGGWVRPADLCQALLASGGGNISVQWGVSVASIQYRLGQWQVRDAQGALLAEAPVLVLANASDVGMLLPQIPLPVTRIRGQVTHFPQGVLPDFSPVLCRDGYVLPPVAGRHVLGATYDFGVDDENLRALSQNRNLQRLESLLSISDQPFIQMPLNGRVGFRCVSGDRMPIVGAMPDMQHDIDAGTRLSKLPRLPGLFCLSALGSRGLVWSGIAAELLADQICGETLRLEQDLADALDPARFHLRNLRRDKQAC
jgi:tRNA 5-methylaminomethyl-2-thiouridine biosynthesis bifunctional protein